MAKNSSSGKVGKGIVIGILAAVIGIGGTCALGYASRNSAGKWFGGLHWKDTQSKTEGNAVQGNVIVSDVEGNGVELASAQIPMAEFAAYGVSAQAETAYTLTITTAPENTELTDFTWSAEFVNGGSAWAAGKTASAYMTVTPAADNRSVVVSCLQAFGEPINVKCVYNGDPTIFAVKKADYMKSITGYTLDSTLEFYGYDCEFHITPVFGTGTREYAIVGDSHKVSAELSDEAYNYITTSGSAAYTYYQKYLEYQPSAPLMKQSKTVWRPDNDNDNLVSCFFDYPSFVNSTGNDGLSYLSAAFNDLAKHTTNQVRYKISIAYETLDGTPQFADLYSDWETLNDYEFTVINSIQITGDDLVFNQ